MRKCVECISALLKRKAISIDIYFSNGKTYFLILVHLTAYTMLQMSVNYMYQDQIYQKLLNKNRRICNIFLPQRDGLFKRFKFQFY